MRWSVRLLVDSEADVNARDLGGHTALHRAKKKRKLGEIARILEEATAV
jgi:ankyrin repeat protein